MKYFTLLFLLFFTVIYHKYKVVSFYSICYAFIDGIKLSIYIYYFFILFRDFISSLINVFITSHLVQQMIKPLQGNYLQENKFNISFVCV